MLAERSPPEGCRTIASPCVPEVAPKERAPREPELPPKSPTRCSRGVPGAEADFDPGRLGTSLQVKLFQQLLEINDFWLSWANYWPTLAEIGQAWPCSGRTRAFLICAWRGPVRGTRATEGRSARDALASAAMRSASTIYAPRETSNARTNHTSDCASAAAIRSGPSQHKVARARS